VIFDGFIFYLLFFKIFLTLILLLNILIYFELKFINLYKR